MLTKFLQNKYQQWIAENPTNLNIDDFVNFAVNEYKMAIDDVLVVLNGQRGNTLSVSTFTKIDTIVDTNTEASIKNFYQSWIKAPVAHTNNDFIKSCTSEFKIDQEKLVDLLTTYDWYTLK